MRGLLRSGGRWAGLAVAVVAAMALGRAITDLVPIDEVAAQPFVHTGGVGDRVELRYAEVEVTGVRAGPRLYGVDPIAAAGQFLVVDLRMTATRESTFLQGIELRDTDGRTYAPTDRGASCPRNVTLPAGLPAYTMFCFDVPPTRMEGMTLVVAKGGSASNGADQRRDDLAEIDLGLSGTAARTLAESDTAYRATNQLSFEPLDTEPVRETEPPS